MAKLTREKFSGMRDWRREHGKKHAFFDVLFMALCGAIAGCDGWDDLATYAEGKRERFAEWLGWPPGKTTPSACTFRRVFEVLHPRLFEERVRAWVTALAEELGGETVALDGKALRGSIQRAAAGAGYKCLHVLHAYATGQGLVLGHVAVDGAPGEVVALPELIAELDVEGAVLTVDANGCTADVAKAAVQAGADYVMCVKGNRGALHAAAVAAFEDTAAYDTHTETREGHGRREKVRTQVQPLTGPWPLKKGGPWEGADTWVRVERYREGSSTLSGQKHASLEVHHYLTSLPADAALVATHVRAHWGVETGLHWVLDVAFREDKRRIRSEAGAHNYATLCRLALSLLRKEKSLKRGVEGKRKRAGWDDSYLLQRVLSAGIIED